MNKNPRTDHIHCPSQRIIPQPHKDQLPNAGLCDFCWDEYSFCWSQYCMREWYETQVRRDTHHPK